MQYIIGIDIGTTHTKAVAVSSSSGEVVYESKAGYPSLQPQAGYHEQDPRQIFEAFIEVLFKVVQNLPAPREILVVSLSSAMHSLMAVDELGQPLTSLWTWADTRSAATAAALKYSDAGRRLHEQTGTPVHPMSPLCKIAWMAKEMPGEFAAAHKFISIKEYIIFRLTGEYMVDTAIASATGLLDLRSLDWHAEALAFAGIGRGRLSRLVSPEELLPPIREEYVKLLDLPPAQAFICGGSDGSLANIGAGAVLAGEAALTIGTSGAIRIMSPHAVHDRGYRLFNYRVDRDYYLAGGAINNGGILLEWFVQTFTDMTQPFQAYVDEWLPRAGAVNPGSDGLVFLPYLHGERAPVWDAGAHGVFTGVRSIHTKAYFLRALMEGVIFSLKQSLLALEDSGVPVQTLHAGGGFTESPEWLRIAADIMGRPLLVSCTADASAMGAAYLGMKACGMLKNWEEIKRFFPEPAVYRPDPRHAKVYTANYRIFEQLYKPG